MKKLLGTACGIACMTHHFNKFNDMKLTLQRKCYCYLIKRKNCLKIYDFSDKN